LIADCRSHDQTRQHINSPGIALGLFVDQRGARATPDVVVRYRGAGCWTPERTPHPSKMLGHWPKSGTVNQWLTMDAHL
jgi:hypothetical protein